MKYILIILLGGFSPFCFGDESQLNQLSATTGYPVHVIVWADQNVSNIEILEREKRLPIYHIVNAFYSRLFNWKKYKAFYDQLYQDPKIAKKYPFFIDISKGLYISILNSHQKLTDLPPYQLLKGKTVEQVFGYPGDSRLMDDIPTEATRQTLIIDQRYLIKCVTGGYYNMFYHEFAHLLHLSLLSEEEFWRLEELYQSAMKENRYLDDYAATNSAEYFGQGLEAYFSVSKPSTIKYEGYKHTREDLKRKDPKLLAFIESLIDEDLSLKDFEKPCPYQY